MNVVSNMFLVLSVTMLLTGKTTEQSVEVKVGQTLPLPQVTIGHIVVNPSITLVKADWEICTFNEKQNHTESVKTVVHMTFGLEIDVSIVGNLNARIGCWSGKLLIEYYFQKLELAI